MTPTTTIADVELDIEIFRKYAGLSLPPHVSYPMPTGWQDMGEKDFPEMMRESQDRFPDRGWSLYLHIPFGEALWKFCACNRVIVPKKYGDNWIEPTNQYMDMLLRDVRRLPAIVAPDRELRQVHWGGGSPTYLTAELIEQVAATSNERLHLLAQAE